MTFGNLPIGTEVVLKISGYRAIITLHHSGYRDEQYTGKLLKTGEKIYFSNSDIQKHKVVHDNHS